MVEITILAHYEAVLENGAGSIHIILDIDSASHEDQAVRKGKFEPELECKAVPTVPQLASSARRGYARPEMPCFQSIPPTLLPPPQRHHRNLLRFALALSRRRRQRRDLPQHAGKPLPGQMPLG